MADANSGCCTPDVLGGCGNNGDTLEESGGSVCAHHRRNEANMLIAESSAGGEIL